ncbi:GNAT family N-acetyltransferase [Stratiformator vulcanicus]|uniref:Acetyltransferase (GNAT) family protein n=1 Tax=Stratiformator vulcanicus TaxID=2527980 RepID=A0A517QZL4_9PLAN|nr:GNAT family N-acetyltransferase [Stratiformator vulcanicus]QDT37086.1 Acetyltransferase (GNAT) family protein [Stratiformator vulcanicus]
MRLAEIMSWIRRRAGIRRVDGSIAASLRDCATDLTVRAIEKSELRRFFEATVELSGGESVTRHVTWCLRDRRLRSGRHFAAISSTGEFVSTLTTYRYRHSPHPDVIGLANVHTCERHRGCGYGTTLLKEVISQLEQDDGVKAFYVLSAIGTPFYERAGFRTLPIPYDLAPECVPMFRCDRDRWGALSSDFQYVRGMQAFFD